MAEEVIGWAIVEGGRIKIKTVSDTRRAAIVNWLVTEGNTMIYSSMSDEEIERLWFLAKRHRDADVGNVTIAETGAQR